MLVLKHRLLKTPIYSTPCCCTLLLSESKNPQRGQKMGDISGRGSQVQSLIMYACVTKEY